MALTTAGSRPKPTDNCELRSWVFMRVSGVILVFLALGHLWIMHVINSVEDISYDFVVERLAGPFSLWRWYDLALLGLAMLHGINGARILIDDYIHHDRWHTRAVRALYAIGGCTILIGAYVLLTFQMR
jgi:succinate dehydrogenase / fumarate reductase, membrane anchor subunit